MMQVFADIEQSGLSIWVRESLWAFPSLLIAHAISMAAMAGGGIVLAFRGLGLAQRVPMAEFDRFAAVLVWGGGLAFVSGVLLLVGYPAKALTNPVFGLKFLCLAIAVVSGWRCRAVCQRREDDTGRPTLARWAAGLSLLSWIGTIMAGRFLAYTHHLLLVS
jgi:hypothetical protein